MEENILGAASGPLTHHDDTASEADLLALADYAWRSDVLVLVAVRNRAGRWRREPFLSLTGARNRYLKARRNGLEAVMLTCELKVTHGHTEALERLQNAEFESGGDGR
ncbi:hypothetical protein [Kytococcus aerolatus]|uniref:hypothetical protein n=1 Tax=Kytococcus aerolatus TaxID=592308 RepID=UPI000B58CDED|nr:hypothetical protein [Kytococcus aerolatus]